MLGRRNYIKNKARQDMADVGYTNKNYFSLIIKVNCDNSFQSIAINIYL
jgi:hypothetical protein